MTVANIAFLLDRLAADTPRNQQIRELTQNAIEAVARRQKAGSEAEGLIKWDVDWEHLRRTGLFKLCIVDNGDGMTAEQMASYLNSLAVQGANQTQSISENFGVGAKITALYRNRFGLVYQSWRDGRGTMVKLHRDDKLGVYGLDSFDLADGPHWTPRIKGAARPRGIEDSGTKVTLLGAEERENTCLPPAEGGGMNWLVTYLTSRYFRLPSGKLQVRVLTRDSERWPKEEPEPAEKTFNLQTIRGTKHLFDEHAKTSGTVPLSNADAHWWLFDNPAQASKDMSTRGGRTCQVGIVFQDEVYIQRTPPTSRRILAGFGILFGAEHVNIYIEPRGSSGVDIRADTARSRVLLDGEDVEDSNWWERWGAEFREHLPAEIKEKIDEIIARSDVDPQGKLRDRILERLKRMREFLRPSRYRRSPNGNVLASGAASGGSPLSDEETGIERTPRVGSAGARGGRSSSDYLADLVEAEGEEAVAVAAVPKEPTVMWVSLGAGRETDEMEDLAAEIPGDQVTGDIIKANADFRGYRDIIEHFANEFNQAGDDSIQKIIVEYVREWMGLQLLEAVMTIRNLSNGRTWTTKEIALALSPYALTAVLMTRYHVVEKVKRQLTTDLARVLPRTA